MHQISAVADPGVPMNRLTRLLFFASLMLACSFAGPLWAAPTAKCGGAAFKSSSQISGTKMSVAATGVTLLVPKGWQSGIRTGADETPFVQLKTPLTGPSGIILLMASDAVSDLLLKKAGFEAGLLASGSPLTRSTSRSFSLGEYCGVQLIGQVSGVEIYVTLIRVGARVYAVEARYATANAATIRKSLDAIVATAHLPKPTSDSAAAPASEPSGQIQSVEAFQGCWSATLDSRSSKTLVLYADGSYRWTYLVSMPEAAVEPQVEEGRYTLSGNSLRTVTDEGESAVYTVSLSDGVLQIGDVSYSACD